MNKHHSGPWGTAKTYMHRFFANVQRCIYIDTDMLVMSDVNALWAHFDDFKPSSYLMLQVAGPRSPVLPVPKPKSADSICSCVMLVHLARMRQSAAWDSLLQTAWNQRRSSSNLHATGLADSMAAAKVDHTTRHVRVSNQGLLFQSILRLHPPSYLALDTRWNMAGCQDWNKCTFRRSEWVCGNFKRRGRVVGIMHANCISPSADQGLGLRYNHSSNDNAWAAVTDVGNKTPGVGATYRHMFEAGWRNFDQYVATIAKTRWSHIRIQARIQRNAKSGAPGHNFGCTLVTDVQCPSVRQQKHRVRGHTRRRPSGHHGDAKPPRLPH